ncbi:hypothetical protein ACFVSS_13230 [Peribacillus butanolivorans]|uniref:hypothetical protein n=1 Tax=Peribacillus butanolivorans TaxID=421767 RepID=UPI0036DE8EB7
MDIATILSILVAAGIAITITSYKIINRKKSTNIIKQPGNNNTAIMNSHINIDSTENKKDEDEKNV